MRKKFTAGGSAKNEEPQVTLFSNLYSQKLWLLVARVKKKGERDRDANKSNLARTRVYVLKTPASFAIYGVFCAIFCNLLMALPEVVSLHGSS